MTSGPQPFAEFYAAYLAEHRHRVNRALHLAAKVGALTAATAALVEVKPGALLAAIALAIVPCWVGHAVFEGNRPTAWRNPSASLLGSCLRRITRSSPDTVSGSRRGRPYYSVLADLKMCGEMLRGIGSARRASATDRT